MAAQMATTTTEPDPSPSAIDPEFEPDARWKGRLRFQIEHSMRQIVINTRKAYDDKRRASDFTDEQQQQHKREYQHTMDNILHIAQQQFDHALERERQERRWFAGEKPDQDWLEYLKMEQEEIMSQNEGEVTPFQPLPRNPERTFASRRQEQNSFNDGRSPSQPPETRGGRPRGASIEGQQSFSDAGREGPGRGDTRRPFKGGDIASARRLNSGENLPRRSAISEPRPYANGRRRAHSPSSMDFWRPGSSPDEPPVVVSGTYATANGPSNMSLRPGRGENLPRRSATSEPRPYANGPRRAHSPSSMDFWRPGSSPDEPPVVVSRTYATANGPSNMSLRPGRSYDAISERTEESERSESGMSESGNDSHEPYDTEEEDEGGYAVHPGRMRTPATEQEFRSMQWSRARQSPVTPLGPTPARRSIPDFNNGQYTPTGGSRAGSLHGRASAGSERQGAFVIPPRQRRRRSSAQEPDPGKGSESDDDYERHAGGILDLEINMDLERREMEARQKEFQLVLRERQANMLAEQAKRLSDMKEQEWKAREEELAHRLAEEARRKEEELRKKEEEAKKGEGDSRKKKIEMIKKEREAKKKEEELKRKGREAKDREEAARREEEPTSIEPPPRGTSPGSRADYGPGPQPEEPTLSRRRAAGKGSMRSGGSLPDSSNAHYALATEYPPHNERFHVAFTSADWQLIHSTLPESTSDLYPNAHGQVELEYDQAFNMLNDLQNMLDHSRLDTKLRPDRPFRRRVHRVILKLLKSTEMIPLALFIHGVECENRSEPIIGGSYGDIFQAVYHNQKVALKRPRIFLNETASTRSDIQASFAREASLWRQLEHPNLLPFLGIDSITFDPHYAMVSPWMDNGNIRDYVKAKEVSALTINHLLIQVLGGLNFLHQSDMVHGDLRAANILIDTSGKACLADFGLSCVTATQSALTLSTKAHTNIRWTSPELIQGTVKVPTCESDVYAFGCVCLEAYTLAAPWDGVREATVMCRVLNGEHPARPSLDQCHSKTLSDELWGLMNRTWQWKAEDRPITANLLDELLALRGGDAVSATRESADASATTVSKEPIDEPDHKQYVAYSAKEADARAAMMTAALTARTRSSRHGNGNNRSPTPQPIARPGHRPAEPSYRPGASTRGDPQPSQDGQYPRPTLAARHIWSSGRADNPRLSRASDWAMRSASGPKFRL